MVQEIRPRANRVNTSHIFFLRKQQIKEKKNTKMYAQHPKQQRQRRKYRQHIVAIHYALGPKIGEGSFGVIFQGENILNKNHIDPVAIKFEPRNSDAPQLRDEFRAYRILHDAPGIPRAYYYGQEGMHNVLIIDLLGPSLEDLFEWCGRRFSIKTTCLLAKQMIQRVRSIHEHDLIYRDIKPDNFLVSEFQLNCAGDEGEALSGEVDGRGYVRPSSPPLKMITKTAGNNPNMIYMVDFGMAKQYRDPRTKQHVPYRERKSLSGTARYMSINTHFGREQSRRDDLESLGHVFFYFLRGSLPWQGLKAPNNKLKYEKIGLTKQKLSPTDLLLNNKIPRQFATYLSYARNLKFEEEPDYDYLIGLMDEVLNELNLVDDGHYDWMDLNNGRGWDIRINRRANLHGYGNPTPRNSHANNTNTTNTANGTSRTQRNVDTSFQHMGSSYNKNSSNINNNNSNNLLSMPNYGDTSGSPSPVGHYYQSQHRYRQIGDTGPRNYDSMGSRDGQHRKRLSRGTAPQAVQAPQYVNDNNFVSLSGRHSQDGQHELFNGRGGGDNGDGTDERGFFSRYCCCCCSWC